MPRPLCPFVRGAAALFLASPALGHALTTRCVATPEAFVSALGDAMASTDSIFMIKLRQGQYDLDTPPLLDLTRSDQVVDISGGWSGANGSCTDHQAGIDTTLLVGQSTQRPFWFNLHAGSGGVLYVHDLGIASPDRHVQSNGVCMLGWVSSGNTVQFERVHLTQCRGGGQSSSAAGELNNKGTLVVRNVLVDQGEAARNGGLSIYTGAGGVTRIAQITVTDTHATAVDSTISGLVLNNLVGASTELSNSVLWGNDASRADLSLTGPSHWLTRVHAGLRAGDPPAGDNTPGSGDPGFVAASNPRLRADSVLVDSGVSNPAGGSGTFDADGRLRVGGAGVDVGAFETIAADAIFSNGFD